MDFNYDPQVFSKDLRNNVLYWISWISFAALIWNRLLFQEVRNALVKEKAYHSYLLGFALFPLVALSILQQQCWNTVKSPTQHILFNGKYYILYQLTPSSENRGKLFYALFYIYLFLARRKTFPLLYSGQIGELRWLENSSCPLFKKSGSSGHRRSKNLNKCKMEFSHFYHLFCMRHQLIFREFSSWGVDASFLGVSLGICTITLVCLETLRY